MDDTEHVEDAILGMHVVHDPVVADAEAVEHVGCSMDRPHAFSSDPPRCRRGSGESFEAAPNPRLNRIWQLAQSAGRRGREKDVVRVAQSSPRRGTERPFRYASRARRRMVTNSSALASTRSSASSTGMITAVAFPRFVTT